MSDITEKLLAMDDHRGDGLPTQYVNPDGPEAVEAILALRKEVEAMTKDPNRLDIATIALTDDPDWIGAGIPDEAIEAGLAAWQAADAEMNNYVSGVSTDWDDGMIVAAIFKAVARAALATEAD